MDSESWLRHATSRHRANPIERPFHAAAGEAKRQAVNAWIRGGGFDAFVDFEKVVRDAAHPGRILAAFDSGDHLHPNEAGHKAMAEAIDLSWFKVM